MLLRQGEGGGSGGGRKVARRGLLRGGTGKSSVGGGLKPTLRQVVFGFWYRALTQIFVCAEVVEIMPVLFRRAEARPTVGH